MTQKKWIVLEPCRADKYVQIIPQNDEKEHVGIGGTCWCKPSVEVNFKNGVEVSPPIVKHNSADMRELIEQAEEIKDEA